MDGSAGYLVDCPGPTAEPYYSTCETNAAVELSWGHKAGAESSHLNLGTAAAAKSRGPVQK